MNTARPAPAPAPDEDATAKPLSPVQRALVDQHLDLVEACAATVARRYRPRVEAREMLAPGTFGLIEAAREFDFEKHPSFPHFADCYVMGRMLDAVKAEHFSQRARMDRNLERSYYRFSAHHVLDVDLTHAPEEELVEKGQAGCDDALAAALIGAVADPETLSLEETIVMRVSIEKAFSTLHAHEQEVVRLVLGQGKSCAKAGEILRVHENTARNRLNAAVHKLGVFLTDRGEDGGRRARRRG